MTPLPVTSSPSPLPSAPLTPLITPLPTPLPASPTPLPPGATPLPVGQTPVPSSYGAPPSRNRLLVAVLAGGAALVIALLIILKSGPSAEDVMAEKAAQAAIAAAQARAGEGDYDGAVRALEGFDRPAHEALRKEYKRRALERREKEKADLLKRVASLESAGQFADALVLLDKAGTGGDPEVAAARERIEKKEQAIKEDYDKAIQAVTAAQEKAKKESTEKAWRDVKEACDLARARSRTPAEQEQILTWAAQATLNADWSAAKEADQRNELDVAIKHGEKAASTPNAPAELTRYVAELKDRRKKMEEKTSRKQRFDELAARALGERDGDAALKLWAQAQEFADLDADKEKIRTQVAAINARMKSEDVDRKYREAMADGEKSLASESFDVAEKRFREALTIRAEDAAATDGIKRVQARKGQKAYDVATGEARAAEKGGEWDKAKAAWKRAIEARPGDAAAGAALKEIEEPAKIEVVVEAARGIKMEFVHIRPGTFTMGDATGDGNEKVHEVVLTKPFWMQTTEVTQAQWEAVMSVNPSSFKSVAKPVENISWPDAQSCAARMNEKLAPQFRGRTAALPNEAQWEYAARAGGSYRWYFGNDGMKDLKENGWYAGNAQYKTQPVAQKRPNAWGLFDMAGNVAEWCADWYGEYPPTATDPQGASTGLYRVYRGGHWNSQPLDCRSAKRTGETPTARSNFVGVRLILQ
jgi:formylglycine-generating enzyme required for sulfatase activity